MSRNGHKNVPGLVIGEGIGVVGLGMHGVVAGGIVLQACTISLSRIAANPCLLYTSDAADE